MPDWVESMEGENGTEDLCIWLISLGGSNDLINCEFSEVEKRTKFRVLRGSVGGALDVRDCMEVFRMSVIVS